MAHFVDTIMHILRIVMKNNIDQRNAYDVIVARVPKLFYIKGR
jgi:hypothetical protein